jgi:cation diffusion facilitator family transporter
MPPSLDDNSRRALRLARLSVMAGLFLAALKISAGWLAGSLAVLADGVESAGDVVASLILWVGLRVAARPADENHPYGHGRYEILAGQSIGVFLVLSGAWLIAGAVHRLGAPRETPQAFALWTLPISILVKLLLAFWKRRQGHAIGSAALQADAQNDWLDVLSGLVAMAALGLNLWQPDRFHDADAWGGAFVGALVVFLGFQVLRDASWALLDTMPAPARVDEVRAAALSVPGAWGIEKVFARKTGFQYHVDLHLEVDPASTVDQAHQVSGAVRRRIRATVPWVADVLIHIEPGKHNSDG